MHARAVGAAEAARQLQHARKARRARLAGQGLPAALEAAGGVGVAQFELLDIDRDVLALHAPAAAQLQPRQRDAGLLEHARKAQRAVGDSQAGAAADRRGLQLQRGACEAGDARHRRAIGPRRLRQRGQRQAADPGLHAPVGRRLQRALPARLQALDQALHRLRLQPLVHRRRQRQALRDLGQRRQVEPVAAEFATARPAAGGVVQRQPHVAARPGQAVGVDEAQIARVQRHAVAGVAPGQATGQFAEGQRLQARPQGDRHRAQRHVGGDGAGATLLLLQPQAQRAVAVLHVHAPVGLQVDVLAQPRHVDARRAGKGLAVPVAPVARVAREHALAKQPDQAEALAPGRLGRGVQPQLVAAEAVAGNEQHLVQLHRWRGALLVHPAHAAVAHDHLVLREEPVGRPGIAGGVARQVDAAGQQPAIARATQLQLGGVDHQLLQLQRAERQHRERRQHARHLQRGAAFGVQHAHVAQRHRRHQPVGMRLDETDVHRRADGPRGQLLQPRTQFVDTRHNDPVQGGRGQQHQQQQDADTADDPAHQDSGNVDERLNQAACGRRQEQGPRAARRAPPGASEKRRKL